MKNWRSLHYYSVSLLAVSDVNNPVGLVGLPYVMWSAHFFVTHIQMEKIRSWNGPTVHVCCFMLARASTKTFVSRVQKTAKKFFVSRNMKTHFHLCLHLQHNFVLFWAEVFLDNREVKYTKLFLHTMKAHGGVEV